MSAQIPLIALIDAMNDKPIAFNRHYVRLGCGINGALMLSQMVYWSKRTKDKDGIFYKTQEDWEEETGLTRYEQETARKTLRNLGFVSEVKRGVPCKVNFKVNHDALYQALIQYAEIHHSSMWDSNILDCDNPSNSDVGFQHTNTENTQEITTDIKLSRADLEKLLKGKKPIQALILIGLDEDVAKRFNEYRKSIKKPLTLDAVIKHYHETCNAGISTNDSAKIVLSESWQGFASRYNWQHAYNLLKTDTIQPTQTIPQNFTEVQGDW